MKDLPRKNAIVSILDPEHYRMVRGLWESLEEVCGVKGIFVTPIPHFTYQVAGDYHIDRLIPALESFASRKQPFRIKCWGIGLFTGVHPVIHIPLVLDRTLRDFHEALWGILAPVGREISPLYTPGSWVPHITLAQGDINPRRAGHVVQELATRRFAWEIEIDNISVILDTGASQVLHRSIHLGSHRPPHLKRG